MDDSSKTKSVTIRDNDMVLATRASESAFRKLIEERRLTGETIVIWREGRVQHIPASEICLPNEKK